MYEPAEDSFLLKEVVVEYCSRNEVKTVMDMGSGSGFLAFSVLDLVEFVLAVDISKASCRYVKEKIIEKGVSDKVEVLCSDLFMDVPNRFRGSFDLLMFNPPYLPKGEDDYADSELYGGTNGIHVTKKFLEQSTFFLSGKGVIFFVASSFAKLDRLEEFMKKKGFSFEAVKKQHISFEDIIVYKAWF